MFELERQLAELMKECSLRSGSEYKIFDRKRKAVLRQIEAERTLTRWEFINLYGYQAWLDFIAEHDLLESHPVADAAAVV